MSDTPLNFLCFITDQQRADHLGCYGNPDLQTPHIDRLAHEGITFTESYVANPVCMPNRASLFTGQFPKVHGVRENGVGLAPDTLTLPEMLRRTGYQTASFGKLHLEPYGLAAQAWPRPLAPYEVFETAEYWAGHNTLPLPYFGLEHVYFTGGHGPYIFGHYVHEVGLEVHALLDEAHARVPPSGARESWKAGIPADQHYTLRIADQAASFIENRDPQRPFFIWCSFPDPHHPYMPPAPYCDQYDPAAIRFAPARRENREAELNDLPPYFRACYTGAQRVGGLRGGAQLNDVDYREIVAHTYGMIRLIDDGVGRVLAALERAGLLDTTVIVFMSDHGDMMGDHWLINKGPFPFRGLLRVPTIWRLPEAAQTGNSTPALISAVDFCPTVLDLAGAAVPPGVQGRSYRDILTGERDSGRETIYIEYDETYLNDRLRHLRTREWALTCYARYSGGLLYDLRQDPDELVNRWDDPAYADIRRDLQFELLRTSLQHDSWQPSRAAHA